MPFPLLNVSVLFCRTSDKASSLPDCFFNVAACQLIGKANPGRLLKQSGRSKLEHQETSFRIGQKGHLCGLHPRTRASAMGGTLHIDPPWKLLQIGVSVMHCCGLAMCRGLRGQKQPRVAAGLLQLTKNFGLHGLRSKLRLGLFLDVRLSCFGLSASKAVLVESLRPATMFWTDWVASLRKAHTSWNSKNWKPPLSPIHGFFLPTWARCSGATRSLLLASPRIFSKPWT